MMMNVDPLLCNIEIINTIIINNVAWIDVVDN